MTRWKFEFISALLLLACLGCGKGPDFLYYDNPKPVVLQNYTQKVKEMQGESRLDMLWVVDNSASMGQWQRAIIQNTDAFIQTFTKDTQLQWKMGLLSSDTSNDPYVGFTSSTLLTHQTPNAVDVFQRAVRRLGIRGDGTEKFFLPIKQKLTRFPDFARKDAILALIIVTDTEDQSDRDPDEPIGPQEFLDFLKTVKGSLNRVVTYSVLGAVKDFGCTQTDDFGPWEYARSRHKKLVDATHGKVYKLCDPKFGDNLVDIGKDLVKRITTSRLNLPSRPRPESIHVFHGDTELAGGPKEHGGFWVYDFELNALLFHNLDFAKGENEEVRVTFEEAAP